MKTDLSLKEIVRLPAVQRVRKPRRPLVSRKKMALIGCAIFAGILLVSAASLIVYRSSTVVVPNVIGQSYDLASLQLKRTGLSATISEKRYSTTAENVVLGQSPLKNKRTKKRTSVALVVSAGLEGLLMPNVVGDTELYAVNALRQKGLVVSVVAQVAPGPVGVVLSSAPSASSPLNTGDEVILRVSSPKEAVSLIAYDLRGKNVVIEPHYSPEATGDPSAQIARTLAALLQAADATVTISRSTNEKSVAQDTFDQRARAAWPDAVLVLDVSDARASGIKVYGAAAPDGTPSTGSLGEATYSRLTRIFGSVPYKQGSPDSVIESLNTARCTLGSVNSQHDRALFAESGWKDNVARCLYLALGQTLSQQ